MKTYRYNIISNLIAGTALFTGMHASGQVEVTDLELQGSFFRTDGNLVAIPNSGPDYVLHVHDASTGITTNLGLDASATQSFGGQTNIFVQNNRVAFAVGELRQGQDLDGDGQIYGSILHIYDGTTGQITNTNLNVYYGRYTTDWVDFTMTGDLIVAREYDTGLVHVVNAVTGGVNNLGVSVSPNSSVSQAPSLQSDGRYVASRHGYPYRHSVYDSTNPSAGVIEIGTGFQHSFFMGGGIVTLLRSEYVDGEDLNGDGDVVDGSILHVYDHRDQSMRNLGIAISYGQSFEPFPTDDGLMAFPCGQDGLYLYDTNTRDLVELGPYTRSLGGWKIQLADGRASFQTEYGGEIKIYDHATSQITTVDQPGRPVGLHQDWLTYEKSESEAGQDLNGDGDTGDRFIMFHNISSGETVMGSHFGDAVQLENLVWFSSADTLPADTLLVRDYNTGLTTDLELPVYGYSMYARGNLLAFSGGAPRSAHVARAFSPVELIDALTEIINGFDLSPGLVNSLGAMLDGVLKSLDPDDPGQGETASQRLSAFINAVEAQRGKKLTDAQADELIDSAQAAINAI